MCPCYGHDDNDDYYDDDDGDIDDDASSSIWNIAGYTYAFLYSFLA